MNVETTTLDYEGSYLLGEADGDAWTIHAHLNEIQSLSLLQPEDVGQRDIFGNYSSAWLDDRSDNYRGRDQRFDSSAYFDGFLMSVRRARRRHAFSVAHKRQSW